MDLSSVIESFASTYTVTRSSASAYGADGRLDAGTTSTLTVRAVVQPVTGRDLKRLPEGLRTDDVRQVFTATELKTQGAGQDPDSIAIGGEDYEVQTVERWADLGGYWRAIVMRKGH